MSLNEQGSRKTDDQHNSKRKQEKAEGGQTLGLVVVKTKDVLDWGEAALGGGSHQDC